MEAIIGTTSVLIVSFFIWCAIADVGYNTTPWAQIKSMCSHYTDAYREGEACITFNFFLSLYQINPDRWELEHPSWGYIRYKGERSIWYDKVFWKTKEDIKQYKKWYKEELIRQTEQKSAQTLKEISEIGLKDIEALKQKIQANTKSELKRIEAEKEENQQLYYNIEKFISFSRQSAFTWTEDK